jgi:hypothetical protein
MYITADEVCHKHRASYSRKTAYFLSATPPEKRDVSQTV